MNNISGLQGLKQNLFDVNDNIVPEDQKNNVTEEIVADLQRRLGNFFHIHEFVRSEHYSDILKMIMENIDSIESYYLGIRESSPVMSITNLHDFHLISRLKEAYEASLDKSDDFKTTAEGNILYLFNLAAEMHDHNDVQSVDPSDAVFKHFFTSVYEENLCCDQVDFDFYCNAAPRAKIFLKSNSDGLYSFIMPTMATHFRGINPAKIFVGEREKIFNFIMQN